MRNKVQNFNDDLSVSLSDVRACLDHWGLKDWKEYLIVRRPDKEGSYIVMANPADKSDFADKLVELHRQEAQGNGEDKFVVDNYDEAWERENK